MGGGLIKTFCEVFGRTLEAGPRSEPPTLRRHSPHGASAAGEFGPSQRPLWRHHLYFPIGRALFADDIGLFSRHTRVVLLPNARCPPADAGSRSAPTHTCFPPRHV